MIIPDTFGHVIVSFVGTGVPTGAAMTFGIANVADQTVNAALSDVVNSLTTSTLFTNMSSSVATKDVTLKLGPNEDGPMAVQPMSIGGSSAAAAVAPNTAFLLKKQTAQGGRKHRGRMFLPGVAETVVDQGGLVTPVEVTAISTDCAALLTALTANQVPMVLLHNDIGTPPTVVTSLFCDSKVATQRRRLRR